MRRKSFRVWNGLCKSEIRSASEAQPSNEPIGGERMNWAAIGATLSIAGALVSYIGRKTGRQTMIDMGTGISVVSLGACTYAIYVLLSR